MSEESVQVKFEMVEKGIALATLNRPDQLNAFTFQMGSELYQIFKECDQDDDVRALVVTGAGRVFCAGQDLEPGEETFGEEAGQAYMESGFDKDFFPWQIKKPIIGAINGHAVGVGLTMPLQWDIRVVAEDAKMGFLFVRRGIIPDLVSTWIVPRLIGTSRALELMMTGRLVKGTEAYALGLTHEVQPRDQVLPRALDIAREIRDNCAPVSVALTKKMIWEHLKFTNPREVWAREIKALFWCGSRADAKEGVMAFLKKRQPKWTLRPSVDWPEVD